MSKVLINDTTLISIANAIREKNGSSELIRPGEMADKIQTISSTPGGSALENQMYPLDENGNITFRDGYTFAYGAMDWECFKNLPSTKLSFVPNYYVNARGSNVTLQGYLFYRNRTFKNQSLSGYQFTFDDTALNYTFTSCEASELPAVYCKRTVSDLQDYIAFMPYLVAITPHAYENLHLNSKTTLVNVCRGLGNVTNVDDYLSFLRVNVNNPGIEVYKYMFQECYKLEEVTVPVWRYPYSSYTSNFKFSGILHKIVLE